MSATSTARPLSLATLVLLAACGQESNERVLGIQGRSFKNSDWSDPVNLGAPVNSPFLEQNPTLSKNGLSLYFSSNRTDLPGAVGGTDLWVSQRDCTDCPWGTPLNLGSVVNSPLGDAGPALSIDGHLLFFTSGRVGGQGNNDIYVSRRVDPKDDFGWGPPVNLGPDVNTPLFEAGPAYLQSAEDGAANLYFQRGLMGGGTTNDIYYASVTRDGDTRGPAVPVGELNDPTASDGSPSPRVDGREILFNSSRAGRLGSIDIWVSTRRSVHDPWSPPENLGEPINVNTGGVSPGPGTRDPDLSFDGRTLLLVSSRTGTLGGEDIWMSTRTVNGK